MARIEITEAQILADFQAAIAGTESEDGYTTKELAKLLGCGAEKARNGVTALIEAGSWEAVKIRRESVLRPGVMTPMCGYRPSRD
ncbi:hypothetical protein LCGC14_2440300 [marine sediment metagenome]|uniref:Uncharacterized protein n=1 Tax=marine sediment metagenome TaxID=412755 RepID=A0A0F9BJ76_9ZZZZ